jgi:type II secretory pathway component PulF
MLLGDMSAVAAPSEPSLFDRLVVHPLTFWPTPGQLAAFYHQLAGLLEAGLTVRHALDALQEQCSSGSIRKRLPEMVACIDDGGTAGDAFAQFPTVFDPIHVAMVRAGERGGRLVGVLEGLSELCDRRAKVVKRFITAILYPFFLLHFAFLAVPFIHSIRGSDVSYWRLALPRFAAFYAITFVVLIGPRVLRQFRGTAAVLDAAKSFVPVVGTASRRLALARWARAVVGLYDAGMSMTQALPVAADTCGNELLRQRVYRMLPMVESGQPLSQAMASVGGFPSAMVALLRTGEESGQISKMLGNSAAYYENQAETAMRRVAVVLPVLIYLAVAIYIAYHIVSFYMGLYQGRLDAIG